MNEKGFSLMELILVVALMAVIMAGLAAFEGTLLSQKGLAIQEITVQGQANQARKKILMDLAEATQITFPVPPCTAGTAHCREVAGYKNVDPADATNLTVWGPGANGTGTDKRYFRYCVTTLNGVTQLYGYWGKTSGAIPAGGCGGAGSKVLAGGPSAVFQVGQAPNTNNYFYRPRNNYLQVAFQVCSNPAADAMLKKAAQVCAVVNTGMSLPLATQ